MLYGCRCRLRKVLLEHGYCIHDIRYLRGFGPIMGRGITSPMRCGECCPDFSFLFLARIEHKPLGIRDRRWALFSFSIFQTKLNSFPNYDNVSKVRRNTAQHMIIERRLQYTYEHNHHFSIMKWRFNLCR